MKKLAPLFFIALLGCAGTPETRATTSLAVLCNTYSGILEQLTPLKSRMSERQVASVNAANAAVRPACASDSILDPALGVRVVTTGINNVKGLLEVLR